MDNEYLPLTIDEYVNKANKEYDLNGKSNAFIKYETSAIHHLNAEELYYFCKNVKGINAKEFSKALANSQDAKYIYLYAKNIKDADIPLLLNALIKCENIEWLLEFKEYFSSSKKVNISKINKAIQKLITTLEPEKIGYLHILNKQNSISLHFIQSIIDTKDPNYLSNLAYLIKYSNFENAIKVNYITKLYEFVIKTKNIDCISYFCYCPEYLGQTPKLSKKYLKILGKYVAKSNNMTQMLVFKTYLANNNKQNIKLEKRIRSILVYCNYDVDEFMKYTYSTCDALVDSVLKSKKPKLLLELTKTINFSRIEKTEKEAIIKNIEKVLLNLNKSKTIQRFKTILKETDEINKKRQETVKNLSEDQNKIFSKKNNDKLVFNRAVPDTIPETIAINNNTKENIDLDLNR